MNRQVPARIHYHVPSMEEVLMLVQRSIQERVPINSVACQAIFPHGTPRLYGDWPRPAIDAWDAVLAAYEANRPPEFHANGPLRVTGGRPTHYPEVSRAQAWSAVTLSAAAVDPLCRLTWPDVAQRLGLSVRNAQHQLLGRMGFAFRGRYGQRRLVVAPCIRCGARELVSQLAKDHTCPSCNTAEEAA